jgi:hypothetical protein
MSHFKHHDPIRSADIDLFFEDDKIAIDITEHRGRIAVSSAEAYIHHRQVGALIDALTQMRDTLAEQDRARGA